MAVTIKEIAEKSGVSRGTVDRVLNHRGNVNHETEKLVTEVAEELGYRPNRVGKALAARKKKYNIGIILCSEGNEFFDEMLKGIDRAQQEAADYAITVTVRTIKGFNLERQLKAIDELEPEINFLILNAIHDRRIEDRIHELTESGIPVITINSDVEKDERLCHVGSDGIKSGETAAGMMGLLTGGRAKVLLAAGNKQVLGHNQRIWGFCGCLRKRYPGMQIISTIETEDDDELAYERTKAALEGRPDITAIYVLAGASSGVCRAIKELGRLDITVIACDYTPSMEELVREGLIKATICQQPFTQGKTSVELAVQYLVNDTMPAKKIYAMKNEIRIYENTID